MFLLTAQNASSIFLPEFNQLFKNYRNILIMSSITRKLYQNIVHDTASQWYKLFPFLEKNYIYTVYNRLTYKTEAGHRLEVVLLSIKLGNFRSFFCLVPFKEAILGLPFLKFWLYQDQNCNVYAQG